MTWLLRHFKQFRSLEAELQEAAAARIDAEDKARIWQARVEVAEQQAKDALRSEMRAHQMVADWLAVNAGMRPIYGEQKQPTHPMPGEPVAGRTEKRQAREIAEQMSAANRQAAADRARVAQPSLQNGLANG